MYRLSLLLLSLEKGKTVFLLQNLLIVSIVISSTMIRCAQEVITLPNSVQEEQEVEICGICFDPLNHKKELLTQYPCHYTHQFHFHCIGEWVAKKQGSCPTCRYEAMVPISPTHQCAQLKFKLDRIRKQRDNWERMFKSEESARQALLKEVLALRNSLKHMETTMKVQRLKTRPPHLTGKRVSYSWLPRLKKSKKPQSSNVSRVVRVPNDPLWFL